ncbi:SufD family Fe-S cluster assembly protein [Oscillospiraceae bacterium MB08-C2-2]|nr:SufD family Fe-S cluster assembly protein [Oscillospiraceae bacterium MB08-C2-2]
MKLTQLNQLQMPTWRWLKLNEAELDLGPDFELDLPYEGGILSGSLAQIQTQPAVTPQESLSIPADMERMRQFVSTHANHSLTIIIPEGVQLSEPISLDFVLDEASPVLVDFLHIRAEKNSRADILVNYRSSGDSSYFHSGFALMEAETGSQVRLIKSQLLSKRDIHVDTTAVVAEAGGQGDVLFCELGGKHTVTACNLTLAGAESRGILDSLYLGSGSQKQDFNYRLDIQGAASEGEITVKGVLAGTAKKVLKSTLDFVSGAAGAKGRESETVLALSNKAVNLSVPLLLCGEENVEGAHATSTGKPDEQKLYYLMSRGFSRQDAKRLLVEASFTPILNKIPSQELQNTIYERIHEVIYDEN